MGLRTRSFRRHWVTNGQRTCRDDAVAVEEPLDIRVSGETVALTMRTPGNDAELALGFLFTEGVLRSLDDVSKVFHCGRTDDPGYGNAIEVSPAPGALEVLRRLDSARRGTLTSGGCGLCGRKSIDDLLAACGTVPGFSTLPSELLISAPEKLKNLQPTFGETGGVHGAAVLSSSGNVLTSFEDIGRHNAVDKALGALFRSRRLPAHRELEAPAVLVVSGRASFEIVQKAAVARLCAVVSVSAPSSMAIDVATRSGLILAAFARNAGMQVYTHEQLVGE